MFLKILVYIGCLISVWAPLAPNLYSSDHSRDSLYNPPQEAVLSESDKSQLSETLRIKRGFGEEIWPGFSVAVIPLLIYNEEWQFLVGHPDPSLSSWEKVSSDLFEGSTYYRKPAANTQAFAVQVGDLWVGSLNGLESMNREMARQVRERFKDKEALPAMLEMFSQTPAQHVAALLHESFHAFQANHFFLRFERAQSRYNLEQDYPYEDQAFGNAWDEEGLLLASAYSQKDKTEMKLLVKQFLEHRKKRRTSAGFTNELLAFEQDLEWLEGLGKYAEMRFAELASRETSDKERAKGYRVSFNRARYDMRSRLPRLGEQSGDLRFYLSGVVQAMLLDRLHPGWKMELEKKDASLEELLAKEVGWTDLPEVASPYTPSPRSRTDDYPSQ